MAKIDLKFIDCVVPTDNISVMVDEEYNETTDRDEEIIRILGMFCDEPFNICLDKSTAIKFAKTIRTEINKIQ